MDTTPISNSTTPVTRPPSRPIRLTVTRVIELMRAGAVLHCSYSPLAWELGPSGWPVDEAVAAKVIARADIAGVGDALFSTELSQTFRYIA